MVIESEPLDFKDIFALTEYSVHNWPIFGHNESSHFVFIIPVLSVVFLDTFSLGI